MMNMTLTNLSQAVFRSVQFIWIFWQNLVIFQSDNHQNICHFIFARLQAWHSVIDNSQSMISRQFASSLWRLIESEYLMCACQSALSSLKNRQNAHEIFQQIQLAVRTLSWSIFLIICCFAIFFRILTTERSFLQNRVLLIISQ